MLRRLRAKLRNLARRWLIEVRFFRETSGEAVGHRLGEAAGLFLLHWN
jgi:hypothetical protein